MAPEGTGRKRSPRDGAAPPFHQRFNLEIGLEQAQARFINRARNRMSLVFSSARNKDTLLPLKVADALGLRYTPTRMKDLDCFLTDDFYTALEALEAVYRFIEGAHKRLFDHEMTDILSASEVDLGIEWRAGTFLRSGAKLLDNALVNENLRWLSAPRYTSVRAPFEKGMRHFLQPRQRPGALSDTITDMYEALEALAKIVTGNDRDLSANAESFVSRLKLSVHYKTMLKSYLSYANHYRHAAKPGEERKPPLRNEVEAHVYVTGLFIRLAIQQLNASNPELQAKACGSAYSDT